MHLHQTSVVYLRSSFYYFFSVFSEITIITFSLEFRVNTNNRIHLSTLHSTHNEAILSYFSLDAPLLVLHTFKPVPSSFDTILYTLTGNIKFTFHVCLIHLPYTTQLVSPTATSIWHDFPTLAMHCARFKASQHFFFIWQRNRTGGIPSAFLPSQWHRKIRIACITEFVVVGPRYTLHWGGMCVYLIILVSLCHEGVTFFFFF